MRFYAYFEAACPIFYDVVFTLSQHEKTLRHQKASSFNAFASVVFHGCSICCHILDQVRHGDLPSRPSSPPTTAYRTQPAVDARRVVNKVRREALLFHLLLRKRPRQLMNDCAHHLEVSQLFGTNIRKQALGAS